MSGIGTWERDLRVLGRAEVTVVVDNQLVAGDTGHRFPGELGRAGGGKSVVSRSKEQRCWWEDRERPPWGGESGRSGEDLQTPEVTAVIECRDIGDGVAGDGRERDG